MFVQVGGDEVDVRLEPLDPAGQDLGLVRIVVAVEDFPRVDLAQAREDCPLEYREGERETRRLAL